MKIFSYFSKAVLTLSMLCTLFATTVSAQESTRINLLTGSPVAAQPCDGQLQIVGNLNSACNGINGSITDNIVTGGAFPVQVLFNVGQTTYYFTLTDQGQTLGPLNAGTYNTSGFSADGHCNKGMVTIPNTDNPLIVDVIHANCMNEVFISGRASAGNTVTVNFNNMAQTRIADNGGFFSTVFPITPNGTYIATITTASQSDVGCIARVDRQFVLDNLTFTATPINACTGKSDGSIDIVVQGTETGTPPYTLTFAGVQVPGTFNPATMVKNLAANGYFVMINDSSNPQKCGQQFVTVPNNALNIPTPPTADCFGTITITGTTSPGNNVTANLDGTSSTVLAGSDGSFTAHIPNVAGGFHQPLVSTFNSDNPSCVVSLQVNVNVPSQLSITTVSVNSCNGQPNGSIQIGVTGAVTGTPPYRVSVNGAPSVPFTGGNHTTISGLTANSYAVIVTDSSNPQLCKAANVSIVDIDPLLTIQPLAKYDCSGRFTLSGTASPGATVNVTGPATGSTTALADGTYTITLGPVANPVTATYHVQAQINNGIQPCLSAQLSGVVQAATGLDVSITGTTSLCAGGTIVLSAISLNGTAPFTYKWTLPDNTHPTTQHITFPATSPGNLTFSVIITDALGCIGNATQIVNVLVCPPVLSITKSSPGATIPSQGNTTFTISVSNTGQEAATNVRVTDIFPSQLTFVSATGTGWTFAPAGQVLNAMLPSLGINQIASFDVTVNSNSCPGQFVTNNASVASNETPVALSTSLVVEAVAT